MKGSWFTKGCFRQGNVCWTVPCVLSDRNISLPLPVLKLALAASSSSLHGCCSYSLCAHLQLVLFELLCALHQTFWR